MKAVKYGRYGGPEVIQIIDIDKPTPKDNEVLVKVHTSSLSPAECAFRKADPFIVRFFAGLTAPKAIPGDMFAGVIDAIGKDVTEFQLGDRVLGTTAPATGTHAEYVTLKDSQAIIKIPDSLSFEEGSSIADGAITALPFLRDSGQIKAGDHILINGASGSIGTYAIQLSKYYGAEVTAVCSGKNTDLVKTLGADHVIDYRKRNFTGNHDCYNIIFDAVGKSSYSKCKAALTANGRYLTTVPSFEVMLHSLLTKISKGPKAIFAATGLRKAEDKIPDFRFLANLAHEGRLRSIIDDTYSFSTIKEGHAYVDSGHKVGNVVLKITEE